jgi:cyclophilin family peptidyl-prolyl cis-trans isomerase
MAAAQFVPRSAVRIFASIALAVACLVPQLAGATFVRMETNLGVIDIELYDMQAPLTVTNFLNYAARGDYNGTAIHRSVPGFVIQGGGYVFAGYALGFPVVFHIPEDPPVLNEFSPTRSNVRGTIAMAKLGGDPNSATSEWFFNLADNSANLDNQNGGFTVFGRVIAGMNVVDTIAGLRVLYAPGLNPAFTDLPVMDSYILGNLLQPTDLVTVIRMLKVGYAVNLSGGLATFTADADMTFNLVGTQNSFISQLLLSTFSPPPNSIVQFNDGIFTFNITGAMDPVGDVVTLYDGATTRPTRYYAYGPTPDNNAAHWYDFTFDGTTGAEILSDRIVLHFVDGQRGDDDMTANGSITHTGAPAVETSASSKSKAGGCTIAETPSQMARAGDWVLIFVFFVFVALARKQARA